MSIKIETLQIRNFKRVQIAEVEFSESGCTILGGANAQGKSTFLDAIKYLLGGAKYSPTNPHNANADGATAVIRSRLSNGIEVERSGKNGALKVVVDNAKGNQATLNEFINEFALVIDKFMRAPEKDKTKMLIDHLGIGDKLEFLDTQIEKLFNERTSVNREAKRRRQYADSIETFDNAPAERIDVTELIKKERELSEQNRAHEANLKRLQEVREMGRQKKAKIEELQAQIDQLNAEMKEHKTEFLDLQSKTETFTPHDTAEIDKQIENADALNRMFEANEKAKQADKEAKDSEKEAQDLTDEINEAREKRNKLIDEIKMPLDGLKIEEGELLYNGQRWDCMSGSERLKVATAISRAFKPECGFVLVDELEQMDWKTIKEFDAWAKQEGIQIIGAMVCDDDKASENVIIIEDGKVKSNA